MLPESGPPPRPNERPSPASFVSSASFATRNSTQSITQNTTTTVAFTTEINDPASAYNSTTGVYTAPVAGTYSFSAGMYWTNAVTLGSTYMAFRHKGTDDYAYVYFPSSAPQCASLSGFYMAAGETMEVIVNTSTSGNSTAATATTTRYTFFCGARTGG